MTTIHHQHLLLALFPEGLPRSLNARGIVVWSLAASAEDDEGMFVTCSAGDSGKSLLSDTHEVVGA